MSITSQQILVHAPKRTRQPGRIDWVAEVNGPHPGAIRFHISGDSYAQDEAHNDAFVLPAYIHALHLGLPVHFDFAVSHRLVINLTDALGPLLVSFAPDLFQRSIKITAKEFLWGPFAGGSQSGSVTGMSCGLDSFATVNHAFGLPKYSNRRLSALAHFDVGNHSPLGLPADKLYLERVSRALLVAKELGVPLIDIRSNVGDWIPGSFARLHTLRNASAAYLTYPQAGTYVYSNGVRIQDTSLSANDSAYIDSLLLPLLSTPYLEFVQGTPSWGAPEKTQAILDDQLAQKHLNVCYFEGQNCGICEKCLRRALLIDTFGRLDDFSKVLNPAVFYENKDWYVGYVLMRESTSPVMRELALHLRKTGYLAKGDWFYRKKWMLRRIENWILRRIGRPRRPL